MASRFNPLKADAHWQKVWDEGSTFRARDDSGRPKSYVLEMFPYPSGRIHMGHVRNYTMGDVLARYRRMNGFEVLHPMGWDAFGMPAENAAMERNVHPGEWTRANIATMKAQLKRLGFALDWSRELATCEPDYYGHEQALFLDLHEAGLVYRKQSEVNWDPVDMTVLANEQVIDGRGWRSGAPVERRKLNQWFLKITDFAEELLDGLETLDQWPDKVRLMQENWIGKSRGMKFRFEIPPYVPGRFDAVEVFTTRPDTIFGASFVALSPDHPIAADLADNDPAAAAFIAQCKRGGTTAAELETAEKLGFKTGLEVVHPLDPDWRLPVYIANFVLMDYGTGAIFGVPGHDQRDFEFAAKYGLPIVRVIAASPDDAGKPVEGEAESGDGVLVNSRFLDGLPVEQAKAAVIARAEAEGWGEGTIVWRLRDWGVSRQRYWGTPIPIIHCDKCGAVPVPKDQLPVVLPEDVTFDVPGNPLDRHLPWKSVDCPVCGGQAARETDTLDTFVEFGLVFHPFRQPARRPAVRQGSGRALAAGRSIYRRRRACDPAPALRPLLDAGAQAAGDDRCGRAVPGPVHARHGDPRNLSERTRTDRPQAKNRLTRRRGRHGPPDFSTRSNDATERCFPRIGRWRPAASRRCPNRSATPSIPSRSSTNMAPTRCAGSCSPIRPPSATSNGARRGSKGRGGSCSGCGGSPRRKGAAKARTRRSTASSTRPSPPSAPISRRCPSTRRWPISTSSPMRSRRRRPRPRAAPRSRR